MRRTTICRSSQTLLTALVAAPLLVTALGAQDTTHVDTTRVDTTRVEGAQGQIPTSHVVVRGETLWSIAQTYYGDPLLWPEIYRLNTAVVEDPHWIYPGEELLLAPATTLAQAPTDTATTVPQGHAADTVHADTVKARGDTIAAVADTSAVVDTTVVEPPPPAVAETYQTIFDRARPRSAEIRDILRAYNSTAYHPVRRGEYYSAGWLTENENLPWAKVLGNTARPSIPALAEHTTAGEFEEIAIEPPRHASYHVGDSLLVARLDRDEVGWGQVVVPLGVGRVTSVQPHQILAQVVMQFGRIHDGHLALPLEPYKDPGNVRPTPVAQGLEARLVDSRDQHPLVGVQQIYFIDKGRAEGVTPGDLFEIYRPATGDPRSASEEVRVQLLIVHTREHSASGLVVGVANPDVAPGMPVRLVKKMPS